VPEPELEQAPAGQVHYPGQQDDDKDDQDNPDNGNHEAREYKSAHFSHSGNASRCTRLSGRPRALMSKGRNLVIRSTVTSRQHRRGGYAGRRGACSAAEGCPQAPVVRLAGRAARRVRGRARESAPHVPVGQVGVRRTGAGPWNARSHPVSPRSAASSSFSQRSGPPPRGYLAQARSFTVAEEIGKRPHGPAGRARPS
jgi:hypothetical protein